MMFCDKFLFLSFCTARYRTRQALGMVWEVLGEDLCLCVCGWWGSPVPWAQYLLLYPHTSQQQFGWVPRRDPISALFINNKQAPACTGLHPMGGCSPGQREMPWNDAAFA